MLWHDRCVILFAHIVFRLLTDLSSAWPSFPSGHVYPSKPRTFFFVDNLGYTESAASSPDASMPLRGRHLRLSPDSSIDALLW
jgi:hypothetical protein